MNQGRHVLEEHTYVLSKAAGLNVMYVCVLMVSICYSSPVIRRALSQWKYETDHPQCGNSVAAPLK